MPDALALVKRELGPDAVILGTRTLAAGLRGLAGRNEVEITAAAAGTINTPPRAAPKTAAGGTAAIAGVPDRSATLAAPSVAAQPPALPEELLTYYTTLVQNEFGEQLACKLLAHAHQAGNARDASTLRARICSAVAAMIPVAGGIDLRSGGCRRVALIGPPGAGKTTTLCKLAAHLKLRLGKRVAIVSLDMHRLATHDQIRRYGELIGIDVLAATTPGAVRDILRTPPDCDVLLIDTHGVSVRERGRLARLAALLRAAKPDEIHLVLPASLAPALHQKTSDFFAPLGASRVVLSRLDEAVGMGVVLSAIQRLKLGLSYVTLGQTVPTDLEEACGRRVAELILPAV